ncbi:hypothetical protein CLAIMM_01019 isoform 3 [Cladophialophora immunda]|nr:hypothetical protein CLAIMM_01019 isoform 1 [Cladophialophora immunda]OQU94691.1 hypothetical protein CLAIMM_01019 isoform 3 [Cladophialophora immunda]
MGHQLKHSTGISNMTHEKISTSQNASQPKLPKHDSTSCARVQLWETPALCTLHFALCRGPFVFGRTKKNGQLETNTQPPTPTLERSNTGRTALMTRKTFISSALARQSPIPSPAATMCKRKPALYTRAFLGELCEKWFGVFFFFNAVVPFGVGAKATELVGGPQRREKCQQKNIKSDLAMKGGCKCLYLVV